MRHSPFIRGKCHCCSFWHYPIAPSFDRSLYSSLSQHDLTVTLLHTHTLSVSQPHQSESKKEKKLSAGAEFMLMNQVRIFPSFFLSHFYIVHFISPLIMPSGYVRHTEANEDDGKSEAKNEIISSCMLKPYQKWLPITVVYLFFLFSVCVVCLCDSLCHSENSKSNRFVVPKIICRFQCTISIPLESIIFSFSLSLIL